MKFIRQQKEDTVEDSRPSPVCEIGGRKALSQSHIFGNEWGCATLDVFFFAMVLCSVSFSFPSVTIFQGAFCQMRHFWGLFDSNRQEESLRVLLDFLGNFKVFLRYLVRIDFHICIFNLFCRDWKWEFLERKKKQKKIEFLSITSCKNI